VSWVYITVGVVIIAAVAVDALWTTIHVGGGGAFSTRFLHRSRHSGFIRRLLRWNLARSSLGTIVVVATITSWMLTLWLGWTFIYFAAPHAVVDMNTNAPADFWSRVYFAGFSLITLGTGDYRPVGGFFQMATVVTAMSGFFIITLAITYVGPIVAAVVQNRQLAGCLRAYGITGEDILVRAWTGKDFGNLDQHLVNLVPMVVLTSRQYLAYPILHYFFPTERKMSAAAGLASLHEAVLMLEHAVGPEVRFGRATLGPIRNALRDCIQVLRAEIGQAAGKVPPLPEMNELRAAGIPLLPREEFENAARGYADQRRLLLALVEEEGWDWQERQERVEESDRTPA
jgi:hypothetical protein